MPLQYNPTRAVIIAASSPGRLEEELKAYNVDPASPGLHVVYAPTDLPAVLALPVDTPWTIVGGTGQGGKVALTQRFGPSLTFPHAMQVFENDLAWAHGRYPSPGPDPTYEPPPEPVGPFPHEPPRPVSPVPPGYIAIIASEDPWNFVVTADNKYVVLLLPPIIPDDFPIVFGP